MVLAIFVARSLRHQDAALPKRIVLAVALVVAATTPLRELKRHVSGIGRSRSSPRFLHAKRRLQHPVSRNNFV